MFSATNVQPHQQEEDQVCGFIHLSFLCFQINFYSRVKFFSPFSLTKTRCMLSISSFENLLKQIQLWPCLMFHHIEKTLKTKLDLLLVILWNKPSWWNMFWYYLKTSYLNNNEFTHNKLEFSLNWFRLGQLLKIYVVYVNKLFSYMNCSFGGSNI